MTTIGKEAIEGLKEVIEIEQGRRTPSSETEMHDGIVVKIRRNGVTEFNLRQAIERVGAFALDEFESESAFLMAYRRVVRQTQETMARLYGVDVSTYRNWEQGHRKPNSSVRQLMALAVFEPAAFFRMGKEDRELAIVA